MGHTSDLFLGTENRRLTRTASGVSWMSQVTMSSLSPNTRKVYNTWVWFFEASKRLGILWPGWFMNFHFCNREYPSQRSSATEPPGARTKSSSSLLRGLIFHLWGELCYWALILWWQAGILGVSWLCHLPWRILDPDPAWGAWVA